MLATSDRPARFEALMPQYQPPGTPSHRGKLNIPFVKHVWVNPLIELKQLRRFNLISETWARHPSPIKIFGFIRSSARSSFNFSNSFTLIAR
jgi:hypothetical protein